MMRRHFFSKVTISEMTAHFFPHWLAPRVSLSQPNPGEDLTIVVLTRLRWIFPMIRPLFVCLCWFVYWFLIHLVWNPSPALDAAAAAAAAASHQWEAWWLCMLSAGSAFSTCVLDAKLRHNPSLLISLIPSWPPLSLHIHGTNIRSITMCVKIHT